MSEMWKENRRMLVYLVVSNFMLFFGFVGVPWVVISIAAISAGTLFLIAKPGEQQKLPHTCEAHAQS